MASSSFFPYNLVQPMAMNNHHRVVALPPLRAETVVQAPLPPKAETNGERRMKVAASRRERCRINQARYRNRQRQYADNVKEHIEQLKEEIKEIENKRQRLTRCAPTNRSVWVVAAEYFHVFRHGFQGPLGVSESTTGKRGRLEPSLQLDFLHKSMVSDVTDGVACGAEALLDNWRLLSLHHDDVRLRLKRLDPVTPDSLRATSTLSLTITESTLQEVFPHLLEDKGLLPIAAKMLDQRVILNGSVRFDWDQAAGQVMRLESSFDLLTPMLKRLGSLEDVTLVFAKAFITLDGRMTM